MEIKKAQLTTNKKQKKDKGEKSRGHIVIPYIRGLSERLSRIMRSHNIGTSFKPHTTIRQILVHPKDKIEDSHKCGLVYRVDCQNCKDIYVGETGRQLCVRLAEHIKEVEEHTNQGVRTRATRRSETGIQHKSAITDHANDLNHTPDWDNASILARESQLNRRQIREAIWIRRYPNMNRLEGAYKLSHTYDDLIRPKATRGAQGHPTSSCSHPANPAGKEGTA